MPTTPKYGLPWPDYSGPVQVPDDLRALAQRLDDALAQATADAVARIPKIAQGTVAFVFTADSYVSARVNYPAGVFTAAPRIIAMALNSTYIMSASGNSLTGTNLYCRHMNDAKTTGTVSAYWIAIQN